MNRLHSNDPGRRARRFPEWLGEEWVWEGVLAALVTFSVIYTVVSPGVGPIA